ncbi:hypothetical protein VNO80_06915 [Phaseolus coccineus]|uniref:Uncharacterized protein n=1 Tax=Phaseolus coccineus TaxID=3886 RepID=A0AAN9RJ50_PHACN
MDDNVSNLDHFYRMSAAAAVGGGVSRRRRQSAAAAFGGGVSRRWQRSAAAAAASSSFFLSRGSFFSLSRSSFFCLSRRTLLLHAPPPLPPTFFRYFGYFRYPLRLRYGNSGRHGPPWEIRFATALMWRWSGKPPLKSAMATPWPISDNTDHTPPNTPLT